MKSNAIIEGNLSVEHGIITGKLDNNIIKTENIENLSVSDAKISSLDFYKLITNDTNIKIGNVDNKKYTEAETGNKYIDIKSDLISKYKTQFELTSTNSILPMGQIILESDTGFVKIGNDKKYNDIPYLNPKLSKVATSGEYKDILNTPKNLSDFNNDTNFIDKTVNNLTNYTLSSNLSKVATSGIYNDLIDKPNIKNVATSGDYNDLINKPENLSNFNNDTNFIDKTVNNLTNYTKTEDLPKDLNEFTNNAGYIKNDTENLIHYTKTVEINSELDKKADKITVNSELDKKANKLDLSKVATSGKYEDLLNLPKIPSNNNELDNGAGYITESALDPYAKSADLSVVATTGNYKDILDLPFIPTKNTEIENTAGYITDSALIPYALKTEIPTDNSQLNNGAGYAKSVDLSKVATSGEYKDILNTPYIPNKVSDIDNDKGFLNKNDFINKGNINTPVYFDSEGNSLPISAYSGTSDKAISDENGLNINNTYMKKSEIEPFIYRSYINDDGELILIVSELVKSAYINDDGDLIITI